MIEIKANSVAYFIENGSLGIDLHFDKIAEYTSFLNASYAAAGIQSDKIEKDQKCWSYILYSAGEVSPSLLTGRVYLLEEETCKYGILRIPEELFLNDSCKLVNLSLKNQYLEQLKIIDLAKKYYGEDIFSIEINIEFQCVADHDILIHAEAFNLTTTAMLMRNPNNKEEIYIEKQLRNDLKKYSLEDFDLNCTKSMTLIDMILE
jgi:hypothetical protein